MIGFIVRRIGASIIVMLGITMIAFLLRDLLPGSLAREIIGPKATPQEVNAFNVQNGLNRALPIQYLNFLGKLLQGNLGFSFRLNQTVDSLISNEIPRDALLLGTAFVISIAVAVPVGLMQAVRRNRAGDYIGTTVAFVLYAMPDFLLGLLLIALFAIHFHWFSTFAPQQSDITGVLAHWTGLILPVVTEVLVGYAAYSRYMRSSAIDSLTQDYVRTARAKGLSERAVVTRHVLRNSLIPMVTLIGISIPLIFTSGLLIEQVFNFQGVALQFFNSAVSGDYPVTIGITVLIGVLTVLGNLVADLAYVLLDPRVRY